MVWHDRVLRWQWFRRLSAVGTIHLGELVSPRRSRLRAEKFSGIGSWHLSRPTVCGRFKRTDASGNLFRPSAAAWIAFAVRLVWSIRSRWRRSIQRRGGADRHRLCDARAFEKLRNIPKVE